MQFFCFGSWWIWDSILVSSFSPLNTLHKAISIWISIATICSIQVVGNAEPVYRDMYNYVGESVTLLCSGNVYFTNVINWYRQDHQLYISGDDHVYQHVPLSMRDRISVNCHRDKLESTPDTCELTINPVTIDDSGRYFCTYSSHGRRSFFGHISLNISTGILPPDDSPKCKMVKFFDWASGYKQIHSPSVGDEIYLQCNTNATISVPATFAWKYNNRIAGTHKGRKLRTMITLKEADRGIKFTCVMTHPGLTENRSCSIIPLPRSPTTTLAPTSANHTPTKPEPETEGSGLTTTIKGIVNTEFLSDSQPKSSQSFMIPVVAAALSLILVIVALVVLLLIKRRKKQDNYQKPKTNSNQDPKSGTTDYAALNDYPNDTKTDDMNSSQVVAMDQLRVDHCNSTEPADEQKDLIDPVYAKPDKAKKTTDRTECININDTEYASVDSSINSRDQANLVHQTELYANIKSPVETSGCLDDSEEQEALMYAELDLSNGPKSDDVTVALDLDATVYADIQRS